MDKGGLPNTGTKGATLVPVCNEYATVERLQRVRHGGAFATSTPRWSVCNARKIYYMLACIKNITLDVMNVVLAGLETRLIIRQQESATLTLSRQMVL